MTLNHMSVEAAIDLQASFKIYTASRSPLKQAGFGKGFFDSRYLIGMFRD
jgi:hypothetical protein